MIVKLLTKHLLEFLSLKGGCRGLSESTLVKMSNCWKCHAAAQIVMHENRDVRTIFHYSSLTIQINPCADPEGETGGPDPPPPPLKNHKNIGFLSNISPDPL